MPRFWGDVTPARSRFERLAQLAQGLPTEPGDLLGALLTGTLPVNHRGCEVLRPLWAEEAVHRAYTLMRLVDLRNRRGWWLPVDAEQIKPPALLEFIPYRKRDGTRGRDARRL